MKILLYFILISFIITEDVIDDVEVIKNRAWEGYETKVGAHYYALILLIYEDIQELLLILNYLIK